MELEGGREGVGGGGAFKPLAGPIHHEEHPPPKLIWHDHINEEKKFKPLPIHHAEYPPPNQLVRHDHNGGKIKTTGPIHL